MDDALAGVPAGEQDVAAAVLNTADQVGAAAGIALLVTAAGTIPTHAGAAASAALNGGVRGAGAISAAHAAGALIAWIVMCPAGVRPTVTADTAPREQVMRVGCDVAGDE